MPYATRPWSAPLARTMLVASSALASLAHAAVPTGSCSAHSSTTVTPVVELYTSEGCSSCPPADRWLSALKADAPVVALAFHVDYWDRLGWKDRFASAAYTQRQSEQQRTSGARFAYTPQVIVDGADRPDWPRAMPLATATPRPAATVDATLARDGTHVTATIATRPGAPARLAAYWALTEQDHVTAVQAGENSGATLRHDHVVRDYRPVATWAPSGATPATLRYELPASDDAAHPRAVNLVIVDAASGRPVQAVKLGC